MVEKKLEGFGGWLILVQIFFLPWLFYSIIFGFAVLLLGGLGDGIPFIYQIILTFLFFGNIVSMFFFYTKRKRFISWFLIYIWITWVLVFLFVGLSWLTFKENLSDLLIPFIYLGITITLTTYIKKSERVKNTFVN